MGPLFIVYCIYKFAIYNGPKTYNMGMFMWFRHVNERKMDVFRHFLICARFSFVPSLSKLPNGIRFVVPSTHKKRSLSDEDFQV